MVSGKSSLRETRCPEKVVGAKYVRLLQKQLRHLRDETSHGNQKLFLDDVFVAYLLAFFNPMVRSLRTLEDLSQTPQAQKHLSVDRICKSTLSDFNKFVCCERLVPIIDVLRHRLEEKGAQNPVALSHDTTDLNELLRKTIAVDGTFLHALADVAWAVANSNNHGAVRHRARLDARINVTTWLPETIVVPAPHQSEADSAIENIQANRIYLYDRAYSSFTLLAAHYEPNDAEVSGDESPSVRSHFVVRYKAVGGNSPALQNAVDRPLTADDRAAGIVSDRVGYFTSTTAQRSGISTTPLREVVVPYEADGHPKTLRLITSLMDVSANTIALLYQQRWQVELFFRWFKSFGHFGHLISHSRAGVQAHLYVAIIGVLLMSLHTGHRASKYMFALVSLVAAGDATLGDILPILQERERRKQRDRLSAALRRAKKRAETE